MGLGLVAGFSLLLLIVPLMDLLMVDDTADKFIYLWDGYVGGFSEYAVSFLLKWGGLLGLCFAFLERQLALRATVYWWFVALSGLAAGAITFVWDVFETSSSVSTGVYLFAPSDALTLPVFLWTELALVIWAFTMAVVLRFVLPCLLRWRQIRVSERRV